MLQGSGTVNFPAGEKLVAGSWKAFVVLSRTS
jgi:hypothetical protein